VRINVDPFIATLGTGSVFLGLSDLVGGGGITSQGIPTGFTNLGQSAWLGIPLPIWYALAFGIVIWYVLALTPLGRMIYATGQGREAAALSGVPTRRILTFAFVASAVLASVAGIVFAARIGAGQPEIGTSYLLPAYAAAFLGSTILTPGRFNVPGTVIATLIVAAGINGLQLHGIAAWVNNVFQGAALIVAVVISRIERKKLRT
jgi:ribose transport system permease protein